MNQHMRPEPIPFYDLASQRRRLGTSIDESIARVLGHCQFINGPEVAALEKALAEFSGAEHVVELRERHRCAADGSDGQGVGPGDAVLCPSFTSARPAKPWR